MGVNSQIDANSANYFNCSSEKCYPSQPVSLWLDDPTSSTSTFTIRTQFRMPLAAVTVRGAPPTGLVGHCVLVLTVMLRWCFECVQGQFQLLVSGTDQNKQDDFDVAFTYNFTKLDVPSAGADQGQRCEPFAPRVSQL